MLMNQMETALINSPPRRWLQRRYEVPALRRFGGRLPPGALVLEIGCGPGYGTQLLLRDMGAARVDAVDLDPAMIDRARRRLAPLADVPAAPVPAVPASSVAVPLCDRGRGA